MKQRNRFGIEFILSNDDEKSSFESYCRYKGIKLGLLKQDDWNIILPSIVALRNAHKSHIKNCLNNDERFSKFVAKTPPKHRDIKFLISQPFIIKLTELEPFVFDAYDITTQGIAYPLEKIRDFVFEVVGNIHENAELLDNHNKEQE